MEVLQRKLLDPNRQVQMLALSVRRTNRANQSESELIEWLSHAYGVLQLTEGLMNGSYLMMSLFNTAPFHNTLRQLADDTRVCARVPESVSG